MKAIIHMTSCHPYMSQCHPSQKEKVWTRHCFYVDHYPRNSWRSAEIKIHPVRIELPQSKSSQRLTWWTNTSSGCSRGAPSLLLMERKPKPIRMLNHLQTPQPRDRPEASSWLRVQPPAQEMEMMTVSRPGERTAAQRDPVLPRASDVLRQTKQ